MVKNYEKFQLEDLKGENNLIIEVNYSEEDEQKDCKILKLTFPDGKQSFVKKEHFMSFLFVIGSSEEQRDMVPEITRRVRWYQTRVAVKAKRDIHKGEQIVFPIKISLPEVEEQIIRKKGQNLLVK